MYVSSYFNTMFVISLKVLPRTPKFEGPCCAKIVRIVIVYE